MGKAMNFRSTILCIGLVVSFVGCESLPISISVPSIQSGQTQDASLLTGRWQGSYICSQGVTGLTVKLQGNKNGDIVGVFEFYPLPQNPRIQAGTYTVSGKYLSNNQLLLSPVNWVNRPSNYIMVSLNGHASTTHFNGVSPECGNKKFNLTRKSS